MSKDDQDEGIHRVETVPPPPGESDAYNSPTKVGPMAEAVVQEIMHAAERQAADLSRRAAEKKAAEDAEPKATAEAKPAAPSKAPAEAKPAAASKAPAAPAKAPAAPPRPLALAGLAKHAEPPPAPPPARVYDEDDEEDHAATLVSTSAKAPLVAPLPLVPPPSFEGMFAPPPASAEPRPPSAPAPSSLPVRSPFAPPPDQLSGLALWFPVIVGFAIFFAGLALYFWARGFRAP